MVCLRAKSQACLPGGRDDVMLQFSKVRLTRSVKLAAQLAAGRVPSSTASLIHRFCRPCTLAQQSSKKPAHNSSFVMVTDSTPTHDCLQVASGHFKHNSDSGQRVQAPSNSKLLAAKHEMNISLCCRCFSSSQRLR